MHYPILKVLVRWAMRLYYRQIKFEGKQHIPQDAAVIYAGNHQSALMDALLLACFLPKSPYFATRADLFKKNWMRRVLISLKMFPIYRSRDGRDSMTANDESFAFFSGVLRRLDPVGIFPEGAGSYFHNLLPLKKGLARLAFKALEDKPDLPLYLVPVGLNYNSPYALGTDVLVRFGPAIDLRPYYKLYLEQPAAALRQLTDVLSDALQAEMIHITLGEDYDFIHAQSRVAAKEGKDLNEAFYLQKLAIQALVQMQATDPARFQQAKSSAEAQLDTRPGIQWKPSTWWQILIYPLALLGLVLHYPLGRYITQRTKHKVKDKQFISTVLFSSGLWMFLLMYLILGIGLGIALGSGLFVVLIWLGLLLSGIAAAKVFEPYWVKSEQ